jgi:hypothetical protein
VKILFASFNVVCPGQTPQKHGAVGSCINIIIVCTACSGSRVGGGVNVGEGVTVGAGGDVCFRIDGSVADGIEEGVSVGVTGFVGDNAMVKLGMIGDTLSVAGVELFDLHPERVTVVRISINIDSFFILSTFYLYYLYVRDP